jgi:hypothetical protein
MSSKHITKCKWQALCVNFGHWDQIQCTIARTKFKWLRLDSLQIYESTFSMHSASEAANTWRPRGGSIRADSKVRNCLTRTGEVSKAETRISRLISCFHNPASIISFTTDIPLLLYQNILHSHNIPRRLHKIQGVSEEGSHILDMVKTKKKT